MQSLEQVPPNDLDVERQVLSACFMGSEAIGLALEMLKPDHFYHLNHQIIFKAMSEMWDKGVSVDALTLGQSLMATGDYNQIGGSVYLAELSAQAVTAANLRYHAQILLEKAARRAVMALGSSMASRAYDDTHNVAALVSEAEDALQGLHGDSQGSFAPIESVLHDTVDEIEKMSVSKAEILGMPTGLPSLDRKTLGLKASELIILGARPSVGKTSLALQIARASAEVGNVAIVSLEMSRQSVVLRMLSGITGIAMMRLQMGRLTNPEWLKLTRAVGDLARLPIQIDDSSTLNIHELRSRTRRLHKSWKLSLLVVDYLGLMSSPGTDSREQEVSRISRGLKAIAKELEIPVLGLSQLSRAGVSRSSHRPQLSDLRDSGSLEQDADMVIFLHREEGKEAEDSQPMEIIIGKQRNGPVGGWDVLFRPTNMQFADLALECRYEAPGENHWNN